MSKTYSAASIYAIIDRMEAVDVEHWLRFHQRLKHPPRFVNVFTASRFEQAPSILRQVKNALPDTTPVWRGYDGRDAWGNLPAAEMQWDDSNYYFRLWNHSMMTPQMAAGLWFARRVKPYLNEIRETGAIVMLLNEANPVFNAPYETECIRILGEEGIRAAAFRWAAGTPDWADYGTDVIARAIGMAEKYNTLIGPHEYAGIKPEHQNSLINRYETLLKRFATIPDVFIGEFGLAKATLGSGSQIRLDPDGGWRDIPVTENDYFTFIEATAKNWYLANKVSFSLYCWPAWGRDGSFGLWNAPALLEHLIEASTWLNFTIEERPVSTPAPENVLLIPRPEEASISIRTRIKSFGGAQSRNLRASWNYMAADIGDVAIGDVIKRFDIPVREGQISASATGKWCYVEVMDNHTIKANGWLWKDGITWENMTATQEVPVVTLPPPPPETLPPPPPETLPPPPIVTRQRYSIEVETNELNHKQIEMTLMDLLSALIYFGQAMGGAKVTLRTETL